MKRQSPQNSIGSVSVRINEWEKLYKRDWKRFGYEHSIFCELTKPYLRNCKNVLELGCGYGRDLIYLAKLYPTVNFMGIDSSATAISILNHDAKREGIQNLEAFTGNWLEFPIDILIRYPMDAVISHFFMHLFLEQEREEILKKLSQILKPKGFIINSLISIYDTKFAKGRKIEEDTFACYPDRPWLFLHFLGEKEIHTIFSSNGFKVEFMLEYIEKEEILSKVEETRAWFVMSRKIGG